MKREQLSAYMMKVKFKITLRVALKLMMEVLWRRLRSQPGGGLQGSRQLKRFECTESPTFRSGTGARSV
jgi:hypothetical protein